MNKLEILGKAAVFRNRKRRVGRGPGSGLGKTSGRGQKGQKSRSGGKIRPGFEGGQMPLQRRLPKRGFHNNFRVEYDIVNVGRIDEKFNPDDIVDFDALKKAGMVDKGPVKLLGDGKITKPLTIKVNKASKSAIEKVEAAGGKVEILRS